MHINVLTIILTVAAFLSAKFIYGSRFLNEIRKSRKEEMIAKSLGQTREQYIQNLQERDFWNRLSSHILKSDWLPCSMVDTLPYIETHFQKAIHNPKDIYIVELKRYYAGVSLTKMKSEIKESLDNIITDIRARTYFGDVDTLSPYILVSNACTLAKFKLLYNDRYRKVFDFKDIVEDMIRK
jgi:hypothetical protein